MEMEQRILLRLYQDQGWMKLSELRSEFATHAKKFATEFARLREERLVVIGKGHGGRVAITEQGIDRYLDEYDDSDEYKKLGPESVLYPILRDCLQTDDNMVLIAGGYKQRRGQWTNPDVVEVSFEDLPLLGKRSVQVSSYEVKTWDDWGIKGVYEAAAHAAMVHRAYLVLEWASKLPFDPARFERWTERMMSECGRFGVGLMTLQPGSKPRTLRLHLEAVLHVPNEQQTERMLEYYLKKTARRSEYLKKAKGESTP